MDAPSLSGKRTSSDSWFPSLWQIWSAKCGESRLFHRDFRDIVDKCVTLRLRGISKLVQSQPRRSPRSRRPHYKRLFVDGGWWRNSGCRSEGVEGEGEGRESVRTAALEHRFTRLPLFYDPAKCRSFAEHTATRASYMHVHLVYTRTHTRAQTYREEHDRVFVRVQAYKHVIHSIASPTLLFKTL